MRVQSKSSSGNSKQAEPVSIRYNTSFKDITVDEVSRNVMQISIKDNLSEMFSKGGILHFQISTESEIKDFQMIFSERNNENTGSSGAGTFYFSSTELMPYYTGTNAVWNKSPIQIGDDEIRTHKCILRNGYYVININAILKYNLYDETFNEENINFILQVKNLSNEVVSAKNVDNLEVKKIYFEEKPYIESLREY